MIKQYGLIGYPLGHSFSKKYFSEKFEKEKITDSSYELFEIDSIDKVMDVFEIKNLKGFNITIPYKKDIIPFLNELDESARKVGAVNVVRITEDGIKQGYNSDYFGFRSSLEKWVPELFKQKALVLGTGGAAKAVFATLRDLNIPFLTVSRSSKKGDLSYEQIRNDKNILDDHTLIINTTPLGMSPHIDECPDLPYSKITDRHYLYDLVYNPEETLFMKKGKEAGAQSKNGLEMLILQAEKSWEIWNEG